MRNQNVVRLTVGAFFMGLTLILSASFLSIPVPGGHFYFNGVIIFLTALLFSPWEAVVIAGIGSFLGDFFFYPAPMFVTLVVHSLQVYAVAKILEKQMQPPKRQIIWALTVGFMIVLVGYGLGRAFVYATPAYALVKIPFDIVQDALGAILAYLIYQHPSFQKLWTKYMK